MNLYLIYSFLHSFYTSEDAAVQWRTRRFGLGGGGCLVPTAAAVTGAVAIPGSCLKWSYDFVL
jgi:hypothetical protein